jgi:hypothetical protein
MMKMIGILAFVFTAGMSLAFAAAPQMPTGSYTSSCVEAEYSAGTLSAICAGPMDQLKVDVYFGAKGYPEEQIVLTGRKTQLTVAGDAQGIQNCNGWLTTHTDCSQTSESQDLGMWCQEVRADRSDPSALRWPVVYGPWQQGQSMGMRCR